MWPEAHAGPLTQTGPTDTSACCAAVAMTASARLAGVTPAASVSTSPGCPAEPACDGTAGCIMTASLQPANAHQATDLRCAAKQLHALFQGGSGAQIPLATQFGPVAKPATAALPEPAVGWVAAPPLRRPVPAAWGCRGAPPTARGCPAPRRTPRRQAPCTSPAPCGPAPPPAAPGMPPAPAAAASPPAHAGTRLQSCSRHRHNSPNFLPCNI